MRFQRAFTSNFSDLQESEPGGSGWADLRISNTPMRLREVGLLAEGHTVIKDRSQKTPVFMRKSISSSSDPPFSPVSSSVKEV